MRVPKLPLFLLTLLCAAPASAAPIVMTSDFIANAMRTNFNGFEAIPTIGDFYTGGNGPYTEDGVVVEQVNGDSGNDIYVGIAMEGIRGWYPNGGDFGYTEITRTGGIDFQDVGFLYQSGFAPEFPHTTFYSLYDNGSLVLTGSIPGPGFITSYLGFQGGGFDEIRLFTHLDTGAEAGNRFVVDSIELAGTSSAPVPEPATLSLLGLGLGAATVRRRTKRR